MGRTSTKTPTAVESARHDVEQARTTLAEWVATKTAAEAELASMDSRSGAEVLDDPAAAERLPKIMGELRDRIAIATRAIDAQQDRVTAAERRYLTVEANALEPPIREAQAALERHQARTAELLRFLEEHEGRFVHESLLIQEQIRGVPGPHSWEVPKSRALEDRVAALERPVLVLRELAAGRDPRQLVSGWGLRPADVYPPCVWGPDALVPAPAYVRTVDRAAAERTTTLSNLEVAEQRVADLEARVGRGETTPVEFQDWTLAQAPTAAEQLVIARRALTGLCDRVQDGPAAADPVTVQ